MRLLLDTHVLLWWLDGAKLSPEARAAISDPANEVLVSAATNWEISIKRRLGKISLPGSIAEQCTREGFGSLPITARHAEAAGELPPHHADPFDRMLIAQARIDTLVMVTRDDRCAEYDVPLLHA